MKRNKLLNILLILVFVLVPMVPTINIHAATAAGLQISPVNAEFKTVQGSKLSGSFTIQNNDIQDTDIDVNVAESLSNPIPSSVIPLSSVINWFNIAEPRSFTLKQSQSHTIQYTINIPKETLDKIYNPIITISIKNKINSLNTTGSIIKEIIPFQIKILLNSSDQFDNNPNIDVFNLNNLLFNRLLITDNAQFNLTISNLNTYVYSKPIIYFHILTPSKDIIDQQTFNDNFKELDLSDKFSQNINNQLSFKSFGDIGEYTGEVLVVDTITNRSASQQIKFIYIPYYFLILAIALILIILLVVIGRKRFNRNSKAMQNQRKK